MLNVQDKGPVYPEELRRVQQLRHSWKSMETMI